MDARKRAYAGDPYSRGGGYGSPQRGPRDASVAGCPSRGRQVYKLVSRVRMIRPTQQAQRPPHSCRLASLAPSTSDVNFAHTMLGCTSFEPAKVAKPQSEPAITFSRPTTLA